MLVNYTLRIDNVSPDIPAILETYLKSYEYIEKYLIYHEIAQKTNKSHFQGVLTIDSNKVTDLKRRHDLHKSFWMLSKTQKSCALVKNPNYLIYITKDNDLRYNYGYSPEEIEKLYSQSYQKGKSSFENYDKKRGTYGEILLKDFKEFIHDPLTNSINKKKLQNDVIINWLLDKFAKSSKGFNEFQIISLVNMLKNSVYDKVSREVLSYELAEKLKEKII